VQAPDKRSISTTFKKNKGGKVREIARVSIRPFWRGEAWVLGGPGAPKGNFDSRNRERGLVQEEAHASKRNPTTGRRQGALECKLARGKVGGESKSYPGDVGKEKYTNRVDIGT